MAISTVVEGALVAHHTRSYDFNDRTDGRRVSGENYYLHVVQEFDAEPVAIKVKDGALFGKLVANGPGSAVRLECQVVARNDRTQLVLVQALPVEAKRQAG